MEEGRPWRASEWRGRLPGSRIEERRATKKGRKVVKETGEEEKKEWEDGRSAEIQLCVVLAPAQWTGNEILTVRFKCWLSAIRGESVHIPIGWTEQDSYYSPSMVGLCSLGMILNIQRKQIIFFLNLTPQSKWAWILVNEDQSGSRKTHETSRKWWWPGRASSGKIQCQLMFVGIGWV